MLAFFRQLYERTLSSSSSTERFSTSFIWPVPRSAGSSADSGDFFEVDEDRHVVLQQLRGLADGILRRDRAVGPDFESQLVVVGHLAETRGLDGEVDLAHRRVDRVDRDVADRQILVEVPVRADIAAAGLQPHLDVELAALADRGDVHVAVEHFDVGIGLDLAAR